MSEIKPCLYCGSDMLAAGHERPYVECTNRECFAFGPSMATKEAAIAAHNAAWERRLQGMQNNKAQS